jgi:iron complex outermembrane receptor protein
MTIQSRDTSDLVTGNVIVRRVVHGLLAASALAALSVSAPALAQQAPAAPAADSELQEIVVTGTMIKRVNAETTEAITILKADVLKNLGITNVEQALNMLTTNTPSINIASAVGSFSGGGTYANLRGLGNGRTLVLLDGQRLANNANTGNAVDLSGIPFSAIDSVQVLREGASALYGSDAIAGVINFITKKNYQGADASINFDQPQKSGGQSGQAEFSLGAGDLKSDGYNFMVTGSYHRQQELRAGQRDFSAPGFDPAGGYFSTNNPGTWPGQVIDANGNTFQSGYPGCAGNPYLTTYFGNCAYKYSVATDLLPESHEASGMISFTKALPSNNQFQVQYFYTRSELTGWSGPMFYFFQMDPKSPYFPTAGQLTCSGGAANCSAPPDLTDPIDAVWSDPNSQRYAGNINTEQRLLLTFSGSNGGWDYQVNGNYSLNKNINQNDGGYPVEYAVNGYTGNVLAPGGILSDLINPFGPQSAAGQSYLNSTFLSGTYLGGTDRRLSLGANASHELGDAFNSGTPATFAIGGEVSQERFAAATTDYNNLVQAATGLTASSVEGSRQVIAAYMELDVPITKALDLDVSDRQDRYSDFGTTNNPKIALRYQPTSFLTLRGTASTGFRAPTLFDLYEPNSLAASTGGTMGSGNPDCGPTGNGPGIAPFTTATCNTQGLGLFGGNSALTPERSQNFDFGIVVSPIQDMGITIDYYRILLKNTIGTIPAETIYANPTVFANQYVLNSAGGLTPSIQEANSCTPPTAATCGYIKQDFTNTGAVSTDGIDLSIEYSQHTSIGTFHEDLEGTAVTQYQLQQYTGGPELNLVGWYNQGNLPAYRWQQNLRVDWTSPEHMWGAGLNNRFYSTYIDEFPDGNGNVRTVGSYSVWEGYLTVKPVESLTMTFGIKNLFDVSPPFTNAFQNNFSAGYNAFVVDPTQRSFFINVKYKFY